MGDMMPLALMVGNWKMNATHLEAIQMVQKLSYRLDPADFDQVQVVVAPPFTALRSVQTVIEADHLAIQLGAQDTYWELQGAFTGEVAAPMLAKLSVRFVIVGHSERRQHFGETDAMVQRKTRAVIEAGMSPIVCVGETLDERQAGMTEERVTAQLTAAVAGIDASLAARVVVAYEPVWAIGSGHTAFPADAGAMASRLRAVLTQRWGGESSSTTRILYGGSVNPGNIAGFMQIDGINGALVGGASLDPDTFAAIIRYRR